MPLLNAAITPHSPILIPEIGKLNQKVLQKTVDAYLKIASDLQGNDIETIIIISPHGATQENYFTINIGPKLKIDLSSFGFLGSTRELDSDLELISNLKKTDGTEIQLISSPSLDYGAAIPLYLLTKLMPDVKIVSLNYASKLDLKDHLELGERIKEVINNSAKKIAVIASGDLSHRLKKNSPAGYSPKGAKFDNKLIEFLNDPQTVRENVLNIDPKLSEEAGQCGLKSITVLIGVLEKFSYEPEVLAYQTDFGIGYLTMNFKL
jgi:aromatic ring-opening dioxygenase LigB subunit